MSLNDDCALFGSCSTSSRIQQAAHFQFTCKDSHTSACNYYFPENQLLNHSPNLMSKQRRQQFRQRVRLVVFVMCILPMLLIQCNVSIHSLSGIKTILLLEAFDKQYAVYRPPFYSFNSNGTGITNETAPAASFTNASNPNNQTPPPRRRLLIAQYTASTRSSVLTTNIYDQFLEITSKINTVYAMQWQHDYWIMRGIGFTDPNVTSQQYYTIEQHVINGQRQSLDNVDPVNEKTMDNNQHRNTNTVPPSRSTYNKITILELALMDKAYDGVLILDADAMMYDFSRDVSDLLSPNSVLIAHKTNHSHGPHTGSINVGVTLWNLRHKLTPYVLQRWKDKCLHRIAHHSDDKLDDDQSPLQNLLKRELDQNRRNKVVFAVDYEFYYARGTFIRHFIRPASSVWTNSTIDSETIRLNKIERCVTEICTKYHPVCAD
jgi:hypothetical protein